MSLGVLIALTVFEGALIVTSALERNWWWVVYWVGVAFINTALIRWRIG